MRQPPALSITPSMQMHGDAERENERLPCGSPIVGDDLRYLEGIDAEMRRDRQQDRAKMYKRGDSFEQTANCKHYLRQ